MSHDIDETMEKDHWKEKKLNEDELFEKGKTDGKNQEVNDEERIDIKTPKGRTTREEKDLDTHWFLLIFGFGKN